MPRPLTKAQKDKQRRQSRGPEDIRRDQDLQNAARLRASQRSQSSEDEVNFIYIFNKIHINYYIYII
jgi:hypothetical protein